jgi:hypothetical protein
MKHRHGVQELNVLTGQSRRNLDKITISICHWITLSSSGLNLDVAPPTTVFVLVVAANGLIKKPIMAEFPAISYNLV